MCAYLFLFRNTEMEVTPTNNRFNSSSTKKKEKKIDT